MDLRKLKTLVDLVSESNITELEITEGDDKVRIAKAVPQQAPVVAYAEQQPVAEAPAPAAPADSAPSAEPEGHVVKSPMVGTLSGAQPGRKSFC